MRVPLGFGVGDPISCRWGSPRTTGAWREVLAGAISESQQREARADALGF